MVDVSQDKRNFNKKKPGTKRRKNGANIAIKYVADFINRNNNFNVNDDKNYRKYNLLQ